MVYQLYNYDILREAKQLGSSGVTCKLLPEAFLPRKPADNCAPPLPPITSYSFCTPCLLAVNDVILGICVARSERHNH